MNNLKKKSLLIIIGQGLDKFISLILIILLSRYLLIDDYAVYRQTFLLLGIVGQILTLGLPNSLIYFLSKIKKEEQKTFVFQTVIAQFIITLFGALIIFLLSHRIALSFNNPNLEYFLKISSIFVVFNPPIINLSNILIVRNKEYVLTSLLVVYSIVKGITILCIILLNLPLNVIVISLVIISALQYLAYLILLFVEFKREVFNLNINLLKEQFKFILPLGLAILVSLLIRKIDQFMISIYFQPKDYAIYSNGAIDIPFISIITTSVLAVITPILVKNYSEKNISSFVSLWNLSIIRISKLIFPIAIFLAINSNDLMVTAFGPNFIEASTVFSIYQINLLVKVTFFGQILVSLDRSKDILYFSIITLILNIVCNFIFIKFFGFIGPTIATVLSTYVISFAQLFRISRILKVSMKKIWPWKHLIQILLFVVVVNVSTHYLSEVLINNSVIRIAMNLTIASLILLALHKGKLHEK